MKSVSTLGGALALATMLVGCGGTSTSAPSGNGEMSGASGNAGNATGTSGGGGSEPLNQGGAPNQAGTAGNGATGIAGVPNTGGVLGTAGSPGTAGAPGYPPNGTCTWTSREVESCLSLEQAHQMFGATTSGGGGSGGDRDAAEAGGAGSDAVCPPAPDGQGPSLHGPVTPRGEQCCYYYTQFCG